MPSSIGRGGYEMSERRVDDPLRLREGQNGPTEWRWAARAREAVAIRSSSTVMSGRFGRCALRAMRGDRLRRVMVADVRVAIPYLARPRGLRA